MIKQRTIKVHGGFETEIFETGAGDPIVFLHGLYPGFRPSPFLSALGMHYRIIAPVHPGWTGASSADALGEDARNFASYYLDLFDALKLERVHLVGYSLGGLIAQEIAAMDRSYVDRMILAAPLGLWSNEAPIPDVFVLNEEALMKTLFAFPHGDVARGYRAPEDEDGARAAAIQRYRDFGAATRLMWPLPDRGTKRRLHRVQAKSLLFFGQEDRLLHPKYVDLYRQALPHAEIEVVPDAGHMLLDEAPSSCASSALRFLQVDAS